jgi:hypothetical protein
MSEASKRFIDLALNGEVLADEIDDFVDAWHTSNSGEELHDFLGMTWQEYSLWVGDSDYLGLILSARHRGQPIKQAINDNYLSDERLAARSDQPAKIAQLKNWVDQQR